MSKDNKPTKFIMHGGIYNEESNLGIQAGGNIKFSQSKNPVDYSEFVNLIERIEKMIAESTDINPSDRRKLREDLESTKSSVTDPEPDSSRALNRLEDVAKILSKLTSIVGSAKAILPFVQQAIVWLKTSI